MEKRFLLLKPQERKTADARARTGGNFLWPKGTGKPPGRQCAADSLSCPSSRWEVVQATGKLVRRGG